MKSENVGLDVTNNAGKIQQPEQSFQLLFENRKTFWRYIFPEEQTVKNKDDVEVENGNANTLISKTAQPLTQNGFVSIEHGTLELPNPEHYLIKPNKNNNKIYSEIYL